MNNQLTNGLQNNPRPHCRPAQENLIAQDLIDIGIIADSEIVRALCSEISADGGILLCHGCGEIDRVIVSFIVIDEDEEAWALCGLCMRKVPIQGTVA